MTTTELAFWGVTVHLFADWFLQNHWMSTYKSNLIHPAGWVHGAIHFAFLLLVFPPLWALVIACIHILIDTRRPLAWWRKVYRQTTTGDVALHVAIWQDQVAHWLIICLAALAMSIA